MVVRVVFAFAIVMLSCAELLAQLPISAEAAAYTQDKPPSGQCRRFSPNKKFMVEWSISTESDDRNAAFRLYDSEALKHTFHFPEEWGLGRNALVADDGSLLCFSSEGKVVAFNSNHDQRIELSRWSKHSGYINCRAFPNAPPESDFDFFCWQSDRGEEPSILVKLFNQPAQKVSLNTKAVSSVTPEELGRAVVETIRNCEVVNYAVNECDVEAGFEPGGLASAAYLAGTLKIADALEPLTEKSESLRTIGFSPVNTQHGNPRGKYLCLEQWRIRALTKLAIKSLGGRCSLITSLLKTRDGKLQIDWEIEAERPISPTNVLRLLGVDQMSCISQLGSPSFLTEHSWWYENGENPFSLTFAGDLVNSVTLYSERVNIYELGLQEIARIECP